LGEGDDRTEPNMGRQRRYMTRQTKEKRRRAEAIPSPVAAEVATIGSHSASKIGDWTEPTTNSCPISCACLLKANWLTDSNFFVIYDQVSGKDLSKKAQAMSITRFWQIVAQHKHSPLSHNFAIVRWPNLIVTQNYTSRTEIDDERNPTQGKGT